MKKILKYVVLLIVTYFVVGFFTYLITKPYYRNFGNYEILTENPKIEVTECKSSYTKGYVKGTVTNNTGEIIEKATVQITIYNKNGEFLGYRYCKIPYFYPQEEAKFEANYTYKNIGKVEITVINKDIETIKQEFIGELDENTLGYALIVMLLIL